VRACPTSFAKANEEAVVLTRVGGEVGLNSLEVNRFVPDKAEDSADVDGGAGKKLEGNFMAERRGGQVVENETDVLYGEEPGVFRGAGVLEDGVGDSFDIMPSTLSKVLVLHESLALPVANVERAEDVLDAVWTAAWSLRRRCGAPRSRMLSSRVLGNCFSVFIPYTSHT
jgi:hypothetical protein